MNSTGGYSSLTNLPMDVLVYYIFRNLSLTSLTSCMMVCSFWRQAALNCRARTSCTTDQNSILELLYQEGASLEFLQWFMQRLHYPLPTSVCVSKAAAGGHLHLLRFALSLNCVNIKDTSVCSVAARYGQLETLKWLRSNDFEWDHQNIAMQAATGGHKHVLMYVISQGCGVTLYVLLAAARGGHFDLLKWAIAQQRFSMTPDISHNKRWVCDAAAEGGHLEILKWLRSEGFICDADTCAAAARSGQLEALKWLREVGCDWNSGEICTLLAAGGHLEALKWARENGCGMDESVCYKAAEGGHLEVLKWARSIGCVWDFRVLQYSTDEAVLRWARENGCPEC